MNNTVMILDDEQCIGTTNPGSELDVAEKYFVEDRFWYRDYDISTTITAELLDSNGNPLPANFVALIFCAVTNTTEKGTSYWLVKTYPDKPASVQKIASFESRSGNTPKIFFDWDTRTTRIRLYNDNTIQSVRCRVEQLW